MARRMTFKELLEHLNRNQAIPVVERSVVTLMCDDAPLQLPEGAEAFIEEHPEGWDHGGWLPVVVYHKRTAYFDAGDCRWGE